MVDLITFEFDHYFSFVQGRTRCANAAHCVKTNYARTSLFRDYFFHRIDIIWKGIPEDIKVATTLCPFKRQLKSFYFGDYLMFLMATMYSRFFVLSVAV